VNFNDLLILENTMPKPIKLRVCTDDTICQCGDPVAANLDGEVALMSITTGKYYCLNETSSRIWELIEKPVAIRDVCQILLHEYSGVDPEQIEAAVLGHISELASENLVRVDHASAA
jgi:hypothetical protein